MFTRPQRIALKNRSQEACGIGLASRLAGPAGRSIKKAVLQTGSKLPRSPKAAGLGVSLVLSALPTAAALRLPNQHWLAWISFLPLFVVVRSLGELGVRVPGHVVRTAHPTRQWVFGFRTSPAAGGDLRHAPRAPPGRQTRSGRAAQLIGAPEVGPRVPALPSARTRRNRVTKARDGHGALARRVQAPSVFNESTRIVNQED